MRLGPPDIEERAYRITVGPDEVDLFDGGPPAERGPADWLSLPSTLASGVRTGIVTTYVDLSAMDGGGVEIGVKREVARGIFGRQDRESFYGVQDCPVKEFRLHVADDGRICATIRRLGGVPIQVEVRSYFEGLPYRRIP